MKLEERPVFGWPATSAAKAACDKGLVIHYDGAKQPRGVAEWTHAQCRGYWKWCRTFHMNSNGWRDVGYSYGVCPHGTVMEGRGWQREQAAQPNGNTTWTSVTLMLGEGEDPTAAQVEGVRELRAWLRSKGLGAEVRGHRDFISTSCPGDRLYRMLATFTKDPATVGQKEDDVALSDADWKRLKDEVYAAVWERDKMPAPDGDPKNKTWRPSSVAVDTNQKTRAILAALKAAPNVDEQEIVSGVLAGLSPEVVAAAVVAALPDAMARQVVTELSNRLDG